ncbi:MAG TPA: hypothetical protein VF791_11065 [Pyrinomonadaceae bacterium]
MHDCRKIEEGLVDLIFGELEQNERSRLLAEVESCTGCLSEYRAMSGTLVVFDQAAEASLPDESFWPEHHEALRLRLERLAGGAQVERKAPFWKRIFAMRLPVPVPIAALAVMAFLVVSIFALRPSGVETAPKVTAQEPHVAPAPTIIEVPVIQEKLVTRVVYREKRLAGRTEARRVESSPQQNELQLNAPNSAKDSGEDRLFTQASLAGFQPPDEMRIRLIKRNNSDEN